MLNWFMGQILPDFNCCGSSTPYEKEITAEIKPKPNHKTKKPSIPRKHKPYTSFKAATLIQSISNSVDTDFAKLEEQNPSQSKSSFTENIDYAAISNNNELSEHTEYKICDAFTKIDDALSTYYQNNGIRDYKSTFLKYIIKHKLDANNIEYELGDIINANDCIYVRFDYDHFPLNNTMNINKNEQIFNALQYCYRYGIAPLSNTTAQQTDNERTDVISLQSSEEHIENTNISIKQQQNDVHKHSSPDGDDTVMVQYTDYKYGTAPLTTSYTQRTDNGNTDVISEEHMGNKNVLIDVETDIVTDACDDNQQQNGVDTDYTDYKSESDSDLYISGDEQMEQLMSFNNATKQEQGYEAEHTNISSMSKQNDTKAPKLKLHIHAKYDGNNFKIKRKVSKLGDNLWQHGRERADSSKLLSPVKVLNEDTSWVKHREQRTSYHEPHTSIEKLQLKKMISSGKIFTAFTPMTGTSIDSTAENIYNDGTFHEGIQKWMEQNEATFNSEFNDKLKENIREYFVFNGCSILAAKYVLHFFKIKVGLDFIDCRGRARFSRLALRYAFVQEFGIEVMNEWGYRIQLRDV